MNDPLLPAPVEILALRDESDDVVTIETSAPPGYTGFAAGQFNMLYVPGAGESAISISGDPKNPERLTHTIRAVGNVTRLLHRKRPGDRIGLRGPFGCGWPLAAAQGRDLLVLAGGIGLAPLRALLYSALAAPQSFRRVTLLVGARSPADLLYTDQLLQWRSEDGLRLGVTVDSAPADWSGDVGVITTLIPRAEIDPGNVAVMMCGPEIMLRFCVRSLRECGVPADAISVSLERNMKCAVGTCGHCQLGPEFLCRDGPVFAYPRVERYLMTGEF